MVLTYSIYVILAILFIWGIKFSGFGNKYHEDYLDKDSTKCLAGLAVLFVILHHVSQRPAFQDVTQELWFFNDIGFLVTSVFLFNSGYGLTISAKNNPNYIKTFARKRILTVLIPFVISNIIFAIYRYIYGAPIMECILGALGLVAINPNGWFPITLLIMYLVFLFNQKHIKKDSVQIIIYILTTILLFSIFCVNGHYAWWSGDNGKPLNLMLLQNKAWWQQMQILLFSGEWWVNSAVTFVVGVVFGKWKDQIFNWFKKGYWIKLIICICLFAGSYIMFREVRDTYGYWNEYAMMGPGIKDKFITASAQYLVPVFFILSIAILNMKVKSVNPLTRFLGNTSYETYLYGVIVLDAFMFLLGNEGTRVLKPYNYNLAIYAYAVTLVTVLIGFIMNKLDKFIIKKIVKK